MGAPIVGVLGVKAAQSISARLMLPLTSDKLSDNPSSPRRAGLMRVLA